MGLGALKLVRETVIISPTIDSSDDILAPPADAINAALAATFPMMPAEFCIDEWSPVKSKKMFEKLLVGVGIRRYGVNGSVNRQCRR